MAVEPEPQPEALTDQEREDIERGEADIAAGRVVRHDKVRRWLESWGKRDELPAPRWRGQRESDALRNLLPGNQ